MLKPFWLLSLTTTGLEVSHWVPTGIGSPATVRLVICMVILDVVFTAPVFRFTVPVVGPSLIRLAVAVTGMMPNCLKEPVAGGSVRVALTFPVPAFTFAESVPGPSLSVAIGPARNVLPVILYLALMNVAAEAWPPAATSAPAATSPAAPIAATRLGNVDRMAMDI